MDLYNVNIRRDFDAPNGCFFKVRIQRSGRNGLLDFADGNFARRPGGLSLFESGLEFDSSQGRGGIALEDAFASGFEINAPGVERGGGRIDRHAEVNRVGGGQAQTVSIEDEAGLSEKDPVAALQAALPQSEGVFIVKHNDLE